MDLGLWCAQQVQRWGGILEQPAYSHLWSAAQLPFPDSPVHRSLWSITVDQYWWGGPTPKATWLLFSHIHPRSLQLPIRLRSPSQHGDVWAHLSRRQRSETPPAFAAWLVAAAKMACLCPENCQVPQCL